MDNKLSARLKSLATPPKKPEISRFDKEINTMAEKMRKDAIDKTQYIENEIVNVAKNIMTETVSIMRKEGKNHVYLVGLAKEELQKSANEIMSSFNNLIESLEQTFIKDLKLIASTEIANHKKLLSAIKNDIKTDIRKLKDDAIGDIEKSKPIIEPKKKPKEEPKAEPKEKPEVKELIKKGVPEHFIDNAQVETYKDLESVKRQGDKDNFLKEK